MIADLINGALELIGAGFIALNVRQLHRDKVLHGVRWEPTLFFMGWGLWNLYYYPSLGQWASFAGGVAMVSVNMVWVLQAVYYTYLHPGFERLKVLENRNNVR